MDMKEECFPDFCSENERDTKILVNNIKIETSDSDTKPQFEENSQHHVMRFNETIKEADIETKIDIKEEYWQLQREDSCVHHDIKDETDEDFYSTNPPSLCKEEVLNYTSDLFSTESLENDANFYMNMDSHECGSDRKCEAQESVVTDASSIETSVCSETSDGKIVSMVSCLKHSELLEQSSTNTQDINKKNCNSIVSHENRKSNKCDVSKYSSHLEICGLVLDSKKVNKCHQLSLKTHKLADEGTKTHRCNICNKCFTSLQRLRIHKVNHEGKKPHKCNTCNKAFADSSNFKRHKFIHEGIKPHKCNYCDKAFTHLSHLKAHKLIHENIKPHKCNICDKAFTKSSDLKRHKLSHQNIKQHKCNICNKAFTRLLHLKSHTLSHEGIKPHKCNICNKAFADISNLKKHKFVHEGTKPHKCNICDKTFTRLSNLKSHKLNHQGIKPYQCIICNKGFSWLSSLKKHTLSHQDIKPH